MNAWVLYRHQLPQNKKESISCYKSSHSWWPSHPALLENLPLCRTTCTTSLTHWNEIAQVLITSKVWESLFLTGSWFPIFTEACKKPTSLTRCSRDWSSLPAQQSLLRSLCKVVCKEKDLQWSLNEKCGSSAQTQVWHILIQYWKLIKILIFRETSFHKLSKVNWRPLVP